MALDHLRSGGAAGGALTWLGMRGRRVDDHPICRKCGFDLFGRPEGSTRCAECGADTTRPRATRSGRRVRRRWAVVLGAMMLAVGLSLGTGGGYAAYTVTDWQTKKPVWWLVREMRSKNTATRDAAMSEATRRLAGSRLSQAELERILDYALAKQADPSTPWWTGLGDFVEQAHFRRVLSDDRWRRYGEQAVRLELTVRPQVRRGDPIPYAVRVVEQRTRRFTDINFNFTVRRLTA
jgi:ribosomal protein L37E